MQKLGLDYETISKMNPKIVYGSFSMYGDTGPMAHRRGGDHFAQAMSGIVAGQGSPGGPPYLAGQHFVDYGAAVVSAFAVVSALFLRARTGVGQEVTNSLLNTATFMQTAPISMLLMEGELHKKGGRVHVTGLFPYGAYTAKDGDVVTIFGSDDDEWRIFCSILDIEHLLDNPRYDTQSKRREFKFELYPILDEAFRKKTRKEWQDIFQKAGLRCDPCLDYAELVAHPQFEANDTVVEVDHPRDGKMKMIGLPIKFKGTPLSHHSRHAPLLGEHTREILVELGYTTEEIEKLYDQGVIGMATPDMFQPRPTTGITKANTVSFAGRGASKRLSKVKKHQNGK
jgi:crotonobetainyl-CoA:carnitine CoA-transferase CaiB-like acyl-CoA transferase